jgi:hypothetical protein
VNVPRETQADALFQWLTQTQMGGQPAFITTSREFQPWDQVIEALQPALFLVDGNELAGQQGSYGETKWKNRFVAFIYCTHAVGASPAAALINNLLDAVDTRMLPPWQDGGRQTLGGIVPHCYIDGEVLKTVGNTADDRQSIAVIPITIDTGV